MSLLSNTGIQTMNIPVNGNTGIKTLFCLFVVVLFVCCGNTSTRSI